MEDLGIQDPSSLLGFSGLIDTDDNDIDLAALEQEVSGVPAPTENIMSFDNEIDKLNNKKSTLMEDKYPAKSVFNPSGNDDFFTEAPTKRVTVLASESSSSDDSSDEEPINFKDKRFNRRTDDQRKTQIANRALSGIAEVKEFDLQRENEDDEKIMLLEEIDMLLEILDEEGVDISRVTKPDAKMSLDEIMKIRQHLRLKNDRNRSRSFAEESFLAVAHGLETLFDGKKQYFGRSPDLTDWSATVNIKLRRMRFDTSSFVNNIMRSYNFGPATRIALELIPSMFLYSRMKKKQHGDDLFSSSEMNSAMDRLRDIQEGDGQ